MSRSQLTEPIISEADRDSILTDVDALLSSSVLRDTATQSEETERLVQTQDSVDIGAPVWVAPVSIPLESAPHPPLTEPQEGKQDAHAVHKIAQAMETASDYLNGGSTGRLAELYEAKQALGRLQGETSIHNALGMPQPLISDPNAEPPHRAPASTQSTQAVYGMHFAAVDELQPVLQRKEYLPLHILRAKTRLDASSVQTYHSLPEFERIREQLGQEATAEPPLPDVDDEDGSLGGSGRSRSSLHREIGDNLAFYERMTPAQMKLLSDHIVHPTSNAEDEDAEAPDDGELALLLRRELPKEKLDPSTADHWTLAEGASGKRVGFTHGSPILPPNSPKDMASPLQRGKRGRLLRADSRAPTKRRLVMSHRLRMALNLVGMACVLYYLCMLPVTTAFFVREHFNQAIALFIADGLVNLFFVMESLVCMYYHGVYLYVDVADRKQINPDVTWRDHLPNGLLQDIVCALPYEAVIASRQYQWAFALRLIRILYATRAPRYMSYIASQWACCSRFSKFKVGVKRLLSVCMRISIALHWFGCIWFFIADEVSGSERWQLAGCVDGSRQVLLSGTGGFAGDGVFGGTNDSIIDCGGTAQRYFLGVYYASTGFTTVGYGDITSLDPWEMVCSGLVMIVGMYFCAMVIASITALFQADDATIGEHERRTAMVTRYLQAKAVPIGLQDQIKAYYEYFWSQFQGVPESEIIEDLPPTLRREVLDEVIGVTVRNCDYFRGIPSWVADQVLVHLKPAIYPPGAEVAQVNSHQYRLFFLYKGTINLYAADGKTVLQTIGDRQSFGDIILAVDDSAEEKDKGASKLLGDVGQPSFEAATFSEVFTMTRATLEHIMNVYPSIKDTIEQNAAAAHAKNKKIIGDMMKNLGTGKLMSLLQESKDDEEETRGRRIFTPQSTFKITWVFACVLGLLYLATTVPFSIQFVADPTISDTRKDEHIYQLSWIGLRSLCDIFFAADIFLQWRHFAFVDSGLIIVDPEAIAAHYRRGWFWPDLLATLPLEYFFIWDGPLMMIFRVVRLIRVLRINDYFVSIELFFKDSRKIKINPKFMRIVKQFLVLLLVIYFASCLWVVVAYITYDKDNILLNWRDRDIIPHTEGLIMTMCRSIYFVMASMTTIGSGDLSPVHWLEILVAIGVMLLGMFMLPVIIGGLTSAVENLDAVKNAFEDRRSLVRNYMRRWAVPAQLQTDVGNYYDYLWSQGGVEQSLVLDLLPSSLQDRLILGLYRELTEDGNVPALLEGCSSTFIQEVVKGYRDRVFAANTRVCHAGRMETQFFHVTKGKVLVLSAEKHLKLFEVGVGKSFGEVSIMYKRPRKFHFTTGEFSQFAVNSREHLMRALDKFPGQRRLLTLNAEQIHDEQANAAATQENLKNKKLRAMMALNVFKREGQRQAGGNLIIRPDSAVFLIWSLITMFFILYNSVMVPFRVAFVTQPRHFDTFNFVPVYVVDYVGDAWFWLTIYFNLSHFAVVSNGKVCADRQQFRSIYMRGWLIFDVLGVFPLDALVFATRVEYLALLRLNRLLMFTRLMNLFSRVDEWLDKRTALPAGMVRSAKLCYVILQVTHWIACVWFFITYHGVTEEDFGFNGVNWAAEDGITDAVLGRQYLRSFYWALGVQMIVFSGDIIPYTFTETLVMIMVILSAITFYSSFVANFAALVTNSDNQTKEFSDHKQQVEVFLQSKGFPTEVIARIKAFYAQVLTQQSAAEDRKVFGELPGFFRRKMAHFLCGETLRDYPRFELVSEGFLSFLEERMVPQLYVTDQFFYTAKSLGDSVFVNVRGRIHRFDWTREARSRAKRDPRLDHREFIAGGAVFGDECLLGPALRSHSAVALSACECFVLASEDIIAAVRAYPGHLCLVDPSIVSRSADRVRAKARARKHEELKAKSAERMRARRGAVFRQKGAQQAKTSKRAMLMASPRAALRGRGRIERSGSFHQSATFRRIPSANPSSQKLDQDGSDSDKSEDEYATSTTICGCVRVRDTSSGAGWNQPGVLAVWGALKLVLFTYQLLVIPFNLGVHFPRAVDENDTDIGAHMASPLLIIYLIDIVFIFDMYLQAQCFDVTHEGVKVTHEPEDRRRRYFSCCWTNRAMVGPKGGFLWDLLAVAPIDLIVGLATGDVRYLLALRMMRVVFRLRWLGAFMSSFESFIKLKLGLEIDEAYLRVAFVIAFIGVMSHVFACFWFFLAWQEDASESWTVRDLAGNGRGGVLGQVDSSQSLFWYMRSLYWAVSLMTGTGFGDIKPRTDLETVFSLVVQTTAASTFVLYIGALTSVVNIADASATRFETKMSIIRHYMNTRRLSANLKQRVIQYYDYVWRMRKGVQDRDVLAIVPEPVAQEIMAHRCLKLLRAVDVLMELPPGFLYSLAHRMRSEAFPTNSVILEAGDTAHSMFFIEYGEVETFNPQFKKLKETQGIGSYFGESALTGDPQEQCVRSIGNTFLECLVLERVELLSVLAFFPQCRQAIQSGGELSEGFSGASPPLSPLSLRGVSPPVGSLDRGHSPVFSFGQPAPIEMEELNLDGMGDAKDA